MTFPYEDPLSDSFGRNECGMSREDLVAWFYGELDDEARDSIKAHVDGCNLCAEHARELKSLATTLDSWTATATPSGAVLESLRPESSPATFPWAPTLIGCAAGLLAFILLSLVGADWQIGDGRIQLSMGATASAATKHVTPPTPEGQRPVTREELREFATALAERQELISYEFEARVEDDMQIAHERERNALDRFCRELAAVLRRDRESTWSYLERLVEDGEIRARRAAAHMVSRVLDENSESIQPLQGDDR